MCNKEKALVWLAKAVEERNRLAFEIKINPIFDPLREDSRFESSLRTVFNPNSRSRQFWSNGVARCNDWAQVAVLLSTQHGTADFREDYPSRLRVAD
jgi:hypothetical protein